MPRRRRRGEGSVYCDRSGGTWVARYPLGVRDGKRVSKRVRAPSEAAAKAELETLRRAYGQGGDPATMTLDTYLAAWLAAMEPTVRASTATSYSGHVRMHISPLLGGIVVARLRPHDVERLIADRLAAGLSASTVVRIVTTLRMALNVAVRRGSLPSNAAAAVRLPRVQRRPVEPLTDDGADAILAAVRETWLDPLVRLLMGSGIRLGEALGLDWSDVQWDTGAILVRHSKTRVRAVPVSDDAMEALRGQRAAAKRVGPHEPVFTGQRTTDRLRGDSVTHALPRTLAAAGLPPLSPHKLRHGVATLMLTRGVHLRVIGDQLGHRSYAHTTNLYAHVVPELQRDAIRSVGRTRPA
jgi:integrase